MTSTEKRLEHRAFLYRGTDDFLSVTVPFLAAGLDADEAVVAVVRRAAIEPLRESLGDRAGTIEFYPSEEFYRHPVRTLKSYQELVNAKAPRSVRALAEPVWQGWSPRETLEWARYESLINIVFSGSGARALCPYDEATLPAEIIDHARRTHPLLAQGSATVGNHDYVRPGDFGAGCDRTLRFERPRDALYMPVESDDLHRLRAFVAERAAAHGLDRQSAQNFVTAANEVAANALQHGAPPAGLWLWSEGAELVCEIGDNGLWRPAPGALVGFIPPDSALQRGFGLWTVRLLVDLVEVRAGWDGTFVRLRLCR
ncbi:anti-sigma factor RsbA family regulatory protein [Actinomadura sp. 9N407]|uniref:anti-sigma factor RsbA family regulatory protein n=1 Tax=Actinomadura sp. 9N407 TaxID=3375154 RepID=UPI0037B4CFCE